MTLYPGLERTARPNPGFDRRTGIYFPRSLLYERGRSETPREQNVELSIKAYAYERLIYLPDLV